MPLAHAAAAEIGGTSVTLSGRVVAGYDYTSNVAKPDGSSGNVSRAASNQWGTSLLTLAAERQIGANTGFATLEAGFGSDKGGLNENNLWSRRAFVGLKNDAWGKLQFGKNLSIANTVWFIDPMAQNWSGSATLVGGRNWNMAPGAIEYATPTFGGAGLAVQYSPGGQVGASRVGTKVGVSATYLAGPVGLYAVYDTQACGSGQTSCTPGRYDNVYNASKEFIVGGTYQLGPAKLFAGWNRLSAPDAAGPAPTRAQQVWLGINYQLTDPLLLRAAIYRASSNVDATVSPFDGATPYGGKRGTLIALGADYALDKAMSLWATLATIRNGNNSRYSSENYWDTTPLAGKSQNTVNFGFILKF